MARSKLVSMLMGCIAGLTCTMVLLFATKARDQSVPEPGVERSWTGFIEDIPCAKSGAPPTGYITSSEDWQKLWKAWRPQEETPPVDFDKEIAFVAAFPNPDTDISFLVSLTPAGDLSGGFGAHPIGYDHNWPGFAYSIVVMPRKGIKTYNGQPFEKSGADLSAYTSVRITAPAIRKGHVGDSPAKRDIDRIYILVENGDAYDRGFLDIGDYKELVIPEATAVIVRTEQVGKITLNMKKSLQTGMWPGKSMSIRQLRYTMGCAVKVENKRIVLGTYGHQINFYHGGSWMTVIIEVPKGIEINRSAEHGGKNGSPLDPQTSLTRRNDNNQGPRLLPEAADGWCRIPAIPMSPDDWEKQYKTIKSGLRQGTVDAR
jgi:hypothetical protein